MRPSTTRSGRKGSLTTAGYGERIKYIVVTLTLSYVSLHQQEFVASELEQDGEGISYVYVFLSPEFGGSDVSICCSDV